jgi:hypothetical protein
MPKGRYSQFSETEVLAIMVALSAKAAAYAHESLLAYNRGDREESKYLGKRSDDYMTMRNEAARSIDDREF